MEDSSELKNRMCRFCLDAGILSINEQIYAFGGLTVANFLKPIVGPDLVSRKPKYPSTICSKCMDSVARFYFFLQNSYKCEKILKKTGSSNGVAAIILQRPQNVKKPKCLESPQGNSNELDEHTTDSNYHGYFIPRRSSNVHLNINCLDHKEDVTRPGKNVDSPTLISEAKRNGHLGPGIYKGIRLDKPHHHGQLNFEAIGTKSRSRASEESVFAPSPIYEHKGSAPNHPAFLCNLCGKGLKTLKSFTRHEKIHNEILDYNCAICRSSCATKQGIYLHITTRHLGLRKLHQCELCKKSYRKIDALERHKLVHSGFKPFLCSWLDCKNSFYTASELRSHNKRIHEQVSLSCLYCNKTFISESQLRPHIMVHKNVRPFECQLCHKRYIHNHRLQRHLKNRHKINSVKGVTVWRDPKTYISLKNLLAISS